MSTVALPFPGARRSSPRTPSPVPQLTPAPPPTTAPDPVAPTAPAKRPSAVSSATFWRRRLVAVLAIVAVAYLLTAAVGRVGAGADLSDRVAGHVVIAPGETLWDVAVATAPPGVDVRRQLADLRALNGLRSGDVAAWTVVRIPAR